MCSKNCMPSSETWSKIGASRAVFIIFPKLETRFNTHYQNAYANAFRNVFLDWLRLSSNSIPSTSREEGIVTVQLHCAIWPVEQRSCRAHAFAKVGRRYKRASKQLCVYHLYRNVLLAQTRFRSHFFLHFRTLGVSNLLIKIALCLSSAKITLKVVWTP